MSHVTACIVIGLVLILGLSRPATGEDIQPPAASRTILVIRDPEAAKAELTAIDTFARRLQARSGAGVRVLTADDAERLAPSDAAKYGLVVRTGVASSQGFIRRWLDEWDIEAPSEPESFVLDVRPPHHKTLERFPEASFEALVVGYDARGVLYGLGKLLRLADFGATGLTLAPTSLRDAPAIAERGAYFASHFNNYYECAPIEEVERYIDDLALWGFNHIWTWFDMNWYPEDFDKDQDSRGMQLLERIRRINLRASSLGLTTGLIGVANEGFKKQPPSALLADMSEKRGGYYPDSTICPSKPGGMDLILKNRRKVLDLVGSIDIFIAWPFDQGSCGCVECKPWATKFLAICPEIQREVKRANPDTQFYVSTWFFNDDEMKQVQALLDSGVEWLDGVLTDTTWPGRFHPPARYARFVFPEISMSGSLFTGYGASGANPIPHRFVEEAAQAAKHDFGAALYSEGIYEDVNKVTWVCTLWNPRRTAEDIVAEYVRYYFGSEHAPEWADLILGLESTWPPENLDKVQVEMVQSLNDAAKRLGELLPSDPASMVRWRYLHDRAEMDLKMVLIGSDEALLRQAKNLLDETGYCRDFKVLREQVLRLRDDVAKRVDALKDLFDTYWAYLERAHLDRSTCLVTTPPAFIGQRDWDTALSMLDRALAESDPEAMRNILLRGFKEWFWHNNITIDFLFL